MKTSDKGIEQIKSFEGFRSMPYLDTAHKLTAGYGHLMVPGDGLVQGSPITMGQATALLKQDVGFAEECVNSSGVDLTQNEFDALVSFTYNLGCGAFKRSTLLKLLKEGRKNEAAVEFPKWCMVSNGHSDSILKRRLSEQECFLHANYKG
jgi:lysozyme